MTKQCALCQLKLPNHPIIQDADHFCCSGCQAVFSILKAKDCLTSYQTHPTFLQAVRYGLISNPELIESPPSVDPTLEVQKLYFEVGEMWCPSCAELIRLLLLQEKGIKRCIVDYATDLAIIELFPQQISRERIFALIGDLGYRPQLFEDVEKKTHSTTLYLRFIIAAFCALNVMMFAYPLYATYFDYEEQGIGPLFAWLSFFVSLPVVTYAAWPIYRRFVNGLMVGLYGMEALVTIGVTSAFGVSLYELFEGGTKVYFDSLCVIIAFVLLGKIIENQAKFSAKQSLFHLSRSLPKRGRKLLADKSLHYVPIKEIAIGDYLQVNMGETIILDGEVVEGEGLCNEALITGEPKMISKSVGDKVIGGSTLQQGNLRIKILSNAEHSTLHRILEMIEQDIGRKSPYVRSADLIARWFVPLVILFAGAVTLLFYFLNFGAENAMESALLRGLTVLLISCPCALGIAAPLAEAYLIDRLTTLGVIVRNRGALQFLGKQMVYVFDKTGTITEGKFELLEGLDGLSDYSKKALCGLVNRSNHPIAKAISMALPGVEPLSYERVEEIPGKGLRGIILDSAVQDGKVMQDFESESLNNRGRHSQMVKAPPVVNDSGSKDCVNLPSSTAESRIIDHALHLLGSGEFLQQNGRQINKIQSREDAITTEVYFSALETSKIILGDRLRKDAVQTIADLAPCQTLLLSGDAETCVKAVAKVCGFSDYSASESPLNKREKIESLKSEGSIVCMIGDGINDSPALTAAHVGISVVSASDISIQVSDLLLTTDRLEVIPRISKLTRFTNRIIAQNLFWAFFYNVIGIALAALGWLSPIFAAFAMTFSSIMVVLNACRIKRKT